MNEPQTQQIDPRHVARAMAVQHLFQYYTNLERKTETNEFDATELKEIYDSGEFDQELYDALIVGVKAEQVKIDEIITKLAPLWPIPQISLIDLVVLRLGIWESFLVKRVPEKVGIDEAIELAKEFSGEISAKFVNGVLGNLLKQPDLQAQLVTDNGETAN